MQVSYVGPHAAVEVPSLGIDAERGKPVEVDDDAAKLLLEQEGVWEKAAPARNDKSKDVE